MRITFNEAGFRELLTSDFAESLVDNEAEALAARANAVASTTDPAAAEQYYEVQEASDGKRARRRVRATSQRAVKHEAKTNALQRGLSG